MSRILFLLLSLVPIMALASETSPVGVWSNAAEASRRLSLVLFDSGRGLLDSAAASELLSWRQVGDRRFRARVHGDRPVDLELILDPSAQTLTLQGPDTGRQVLQRQSTALPADPVERLAEQERARREQRWQSFTQRYQRIDLGPRKTPEIARLWKREQGKPGLVSLIATPRPLSEGIPVTPPLLSLVRRKARNFVNLTVEAAIDPRLPRSSADLTPFTGRPSINIDAVRYLQPANARLLRKMLEQAAISYQEDRFRLDYLQGYRVGLEDRISAQFEDRQLQTLLPQLLQVIAREHPQLMVYLIRRRQD